MSTDQRWRVFNGVLWLFAGAMHFIRPKMYEPIVPPPLDQVSREVVYASGVAEFAGGVFALIPSTRRGARWWLLATVVAVFPANCYMAIEHEKFKQIPRSALIARLPVQLVFGWLVWRGTR